MDTLYFTQVVENLVSVSQLPSSPIEARFESTVVLRGDAGVKTNRVDSIRWPTMGERKQVLYKGACTRAQKGEPARLAHGGSQHLHVSQTSDEENVKVTFFLRLVVKPGDRTRHSGIQRVEPIVNDRKKVSRTPTDRVFLVKTIRVRQRNLRSGTKRNSDPPRTLIFLAYSIDFV